MKSKPFRRRTVYTSKELGVKLPEDYPWKLLGKLAEDLRPFLNESDMKSVELLVRNRSFTDYLKLSENWSPQCMAPTDISLVEFQAKYQMGSLLRKFRFSSDSSQRTSAARKKFLDAEYDCLTYNLQGFESLLFTEDDVLRTAFGHARRFLRRVLGNELPSRNTLTYWSRHGPGANLDTRVGRTSLYFKYNDWPYSCTQDAYQEARFAIENDERWLGALEDDYRRVNNIPKHLILDREQFWSSVIKIVPGNRITFVPKNALIDRSIAIEPSLNLYLQLGVDGFIRRRLKRWGVDLDSQEKNRELARLGSLHWEDLDNFVTLDLAAASDTISTRICAILLPDQWYDYLMKLRSPVGRLGDEIIKYQKISSMGNGFTFALESAIFAAVVYGVSVALTGSYDRTTCAVFGDDIIVPSTHSEKVIALLNLFGFKLNHDKSFLEGPFRESCGADWFRGHPVRPVFLSAQPSSVMDLFTDHNRLMRVLSLRFSVDESKLLKLILRWVPDLFREFIGPVSNEQFDSYLHSPVPRGQYLEWMWRWNVLVAVPKPLTGPSFLFRKLMASLRPSPFSNTLTSFSEKGFRGLKLKGGGSVFTVTKPFSVTVSRSVSVADIWQSEYAEVMPIAAHCGR